MITGLILGMARNLYKYNICAKFNNAVEYEQ